MSDENAGCACPAQAREIFDRLEQEASAAVGTEPRVAATDFSETAGTSEPPD